LAAQPFGNDVEHNRTLVSRVVQSLEMEEPARPPSNVRAHYDAIQNLTDAPTLPEVYRNIVNFQGDDEWLLRAAKTLKAGCPLTAWIVWEQLRRARHMSLADVLRMELALAVNMCSSGQVKEGVRA